MNVAVRPAHLADSPQLVLFLLAMAEESEGLRLDPDTVSLGVTRVFESPHIGHYWVLEDPETRTLVGMCLVTVEWSDWHNRFYWWLQSIYLQPAYRGQGLLQALLSHIEADATRQGVSELRLYVESENRRAIRAYEKQDYRSGHYLVMQKTLVDKP